MAVAASGRLSPAGGRTGAGAGEGAGAGLAAGAGAGAGAGFGAAAVRAAAGVWLPVLVCQSVNRAPWTLASGLPCWSTGCMLFPVPLAIHTLGCEAVGTDR